MRFLDILDSLKLCLTASALLLAVSCGTSDPDEGGKKETASLEVAPMEVSFDVKASSSWTLTVTTDASWTAKSSASWVKVSPASGTGKGLLTVSAESNEGSPERSATVTVEAGTAVKTVSVTQKGENVLVASPDGFDGVKRAGTTYQLQIYSFADSNGDGVGDFRGIIDRLDYLDGLGVTALWLSPIHPAMSYHGYDITDYYSVNPLYGTESDLKELIDKAHEKDIDIYLDYVLNHCGKDHPWFLDAKKDPDSPYRDYFIFSSNPAADIAAGNIAMIPKGSSFDAGQWYSTGAGDIGYTGRLHFLVDWSGKTVTVTETAADAQSSNSDTSVNMFIYTGNPGANYRLYRTGDNLYEITIDVNTPWGFLVRTSSSSWDGGTKWGGPQGSGPIVLGEPFKLNNTTAADIIFGETEYYHSHMWTDWFVDFNYGPASSCGESPAFRDLAASADKWIGMGVDGLRLDAVKHIYWSERSDENPTFLDTWYRHCNASYKAAGHTDDIYMVGEVFSDAPSTYSYYRGLPSVFEFSFWWKLSEALNNASGKSFPSAIVNYHNNYRSYRADAVPALKLSNHDEDRAASVLGKSAAKIRQAAAVLLTAEGKPFIYHGEELGYWGTKENGDEYVRTPIAWSKDLSDLCSKGVSGKVDKSMVTADISVEAQGEDEGSLLNVYRTFSRLRNTYPALATGTMDASTGIDDNAVASWYMTSTDGGRMLVVHNFSSGKVRVAVKDDMSSPVAVLGTAATDGGNLTLGGNSSVVFKLK